MFEPISLGVPMNSMFKWGWSSLCKSYHLHFEFMQSNGQFTLLIHGVQATIVTFSFLVNTPCGLCFLVLPFK